MIYIDSWVIVEFFSEGPRFEKVKDVLERIQEGEAGVISSVVVTEVKYRISKARGAERARRVIHEILNFPEITVLPVTTDIASMAADLKLKYYAAGKRLLSLADVIHLATALISKCNTFYSGDPDFKDIKEIKTVVV